MLPIDPSTAPWIEGKGYRKQPLLTEEALRCPGTLVQIVEIGVGSYVPMHVHGTSLEVFTILSGTGTMTIAGQELTLGPGDMATTEPGDYHDARNIGDVPWRILVFKTNAKPDDSTWSKS